MYFLVYCVEIACIIFYILFSLSGLKEFYEFYTVFSVDLKLNTHDSTLNRLLRVNFSAFLEKVSNIGIKMH